MVCITFIALIAQVEFLFICYFARQSECDSFLTNYICKCACKCLGLSDNIS